MEHSYFSAGGRWLDRKRRVTEPPSIFGRRVTLVVHVSDVFVWTIVNTCMRHLIEYLASIIHIMVQWCVYLYYKVGKRNGWCTPLFKSNRNFFCNVKRCYLFSMYRFEILRAVWWGLVHLLWKISWVYVIASRLCEHSNVVKFEKRSAKTPQHGHRYGNILMLYDTINTHGCFFCYNWHELCSSNKLLDFSIINCFLVKYAIKYQTWMSSYPTPCYADIQQAVPLDSGAGTSSYWVMPSHAAISNFSIFWGKA